MTTLCGWYLKTYFNMYSRTHTHMEIRRVLLMVSWFPRWYLCGGIRKSLRILPIIMCYPRNNQQTDTNILSTPLCFVYLNKFWNVWNSRIIAWSFVTGETALAFENMYTTVKVCIPSWCIILTFPGMRYRVRSPPMWPLLHHINCFHPPPQIIHPGCLKSCSILCVFYWGMCPSPGPYFRVTCGINWIWVVLLYVHTQL